MSLQGSKVNRLEFIKRCSLILIEFILNTSWILFSYNLGVTGTDTASFGNFDVTVCWYRVCVCVFVWWVQRGPGSIHESDVQMRTDRNSSTRRLVAGRLIHISARKLAAFLPPWLLLLLAVARLSSLITGKFILLDSHLKQEDVLGNSSDSVTILT